MNKEIDMIKEMRKGTNILLKIIANLLNDALSKKDELLRRDVAEIVTFMNEELIEDDEE